MTLRERLEWLGRMVLLVFFYLHARAELAPDEDQSVIFSIGKGRRCSSACSGWN